MLDSLKLFVTFGLFPLTLLLNGGLVCEPLLYFQETDLIWMTFERMDNLECLLLVRREG